MSGVVLPLPPKKVFGKADRQFLVDRQQKLQKFLEVLLADPLLLADIRVKRFLDPRNYSDNFQGDNGGKAYFLSLMFSLLHRGGSSQCVHVLSL